MFKKNISVQTKDITMLIKLRFIGLLLILLFNTSTFGQNNFSSKSLYELHDDLNYWHNTVDKGDWWFFRRMRGSIDRAPDFLPSMKGLRIWMRETYGKDYFYFDSKNELNVKFSSMAYDKNRPFDVIKWEVLREIQAMNQFSNNMKAWHRNNTIPAIENAIRNHPDNPNNPNFHLNPFDPNDQGNNIVNQPEASGATSCHSRGKGDFRIGTGRLQYRCIYYGSGQLHQEIPYVNNKRQGTEMIYYKNGKLSGKVDYWDDYVTISRSFDKNGKLVCKKFDRGEYLGRCN